MLLLIIKFHMLIDILDYQKIYLKEYVLNDKNLFLPDVATKYLNIEHGYKPVKWEEKTLKRIAGSKGHLSGIELTKHRGNI